MVESFKMLVNKHEYSRKPSEREVAKIVKNLELQELTPCDIRNRIPSGISFRPAIFDGDKFVSQQLFYVDVDNVNEIRSVKDNLCLCERLNLVPMLVYKTFRGNFENQKHRICFATDEPITDIKVRNKIQKKLTAIFAGDTAANNEKRLLFGGNLCYFYGDGISITVNDVNKAYKRYKETIAA